MRFAPLVLPALLAACATPGVTPMTGAAPPSGSSRQVVHGTEAPVFLSGPSPIPDEAILECTRRVLVARCVITVEGRATRCAIVEGAGPRVDRAVIRRLEQRRYRPARTDGRPVEAALTTRVDMREIVCWR